MSYLLYRGPSLLDAAPILAALSGLDSPSRNPKTGPMGQVWMIRADISPMEAVRSGQDFSICGGCVLRGADGKQRICYVLPWQAPTQIFKHQHLLKPKHWRALHNRAVRLGAYGNMSAIPTSITADIVARAAMTTGYEHLWATCDQDLRRFLMASCETEEQRDLARQAGWSTFRIKRPDEPVLKGEVVCPASPEGGSRMTCYTCGRCTGGAKKDVVINVHGNGRKHFGGST